MLCINFPDNHHDLPRCDKSRLKVPSWRACGRGFARRMLAPFPSCPVCESVFSGGFGDGAVARPREALTFWHWLPRSSLFFVPNELGKMRAAKRSGELRKTGDLLNCCKYLNKTEIKGTPAFSLRNVPACGPPGSWLGIAHSWPSTRCRGLGTTAGWQAVG